MRDKTRRAGVERALVAAIDKSLRRHQDVITPRLYVHMRTMSAFELGLRFKAALRDELYERNRENGRRAVTRKVKETT